MKVYLVHHVDALSAEQDPQRHISPKGREQAERLGTRFRRLGVAPLRILHSDKQWTIDTAERIAAKLGAEDKTAKAAYPINTGDPIEPFIAEVAAARNDIMMCGHVDYLLRAASRLVCGNETRKVVEFKPGNGPQSAWKAKATCGSSPTPGARTTRRDKARRNPTPPPSREPRR